MTSMIENRESLQEIALRHLDDGVFMFDKDRKIVLFNPACERIVGFP
jgi:PAS domain-containing protein